MPDKTQLAIVGCGNIARQHLRGIQALFDAGCDWFHVSACCDINRDCAQRMAEELATIQGRQPVVFESVNDLAAADIAEAADVCLPHCFHHSAAIPLLEGGLHVLLEKPLGITIKASRLIIDAAETNGCILATAENVRRNPNARACRWALCEVKMIGDLRLVDIQQINNSPLDVSNPIFKWRGRKNLTGGGMIMDSGAHFTDMMLYMFGEPERVSCAMHTYDASPIAGAPVEGDVPIDVEDAWNAVIDFAGGPRVLWTFNRAQPGPVHKVGRYYGSAGIMEDQTGTKFHPFHGGGTITLADGTVRNSDWILEQYLDTLSPQEKDRLFPFGVTNDFGLEIVDFIRAIQTGAPVELDGDAGLRAKALCEACYESSTLGETVAYRDVLDGTIDSYQKPINEFWQIA